MWIVQAIDQSYALFDFWTKVAILVVLAPTKKTAKLMDKDKLVDYVRKADFVPF